MANDKKIKLLVFSSGSCSACQFMKKRKVVNLFAKSNEQVEVEEIDTNSEEGDARADEYDVMSLPTLVFEHEDPTGKLEREAKELLRQEGSATLQELGALYERALAKGAGHKATRSGK